MAKLAALLALAPIALQALPHLLRPPAPPPLEADVGLPRPMPRPDAVPPQHRNRRPPPGSRFAKETHKPKVTTGSTTAGSAATDVIASQPRGRGSRPATLAPPARPPAPPPPDPAPATPPPPPAPAPVPAPPPPPPPGDGSEEFAPH